MRTAMLAVLILGMAAWSWAGPASVKSVVPVRVIAPDQQLCWYQAPHYYLWTLNASTAFGSEFADDVPDDVGSPLCLWGFIFYAGEWAGSWQDPPGFWIDLYGGQCPPPAGGPPPDPTHFKRGTLGRYYFPWGGLGFSERVIYSSPGWFECHEVTQMFDHKWWFVDGGWSTIGVVLETPWGTDPPYAGAAATDWYVTYGCGEGYWCFEYYGVPRWVTISSYFGVRADLAYGLICTHEPCHGPRHAPAATGERPATEPTTWGMMKSLYE